MYLPRDFYTLEDHQSGGQAPSEGCDTTDGAFSTATAGNFSCTCLCTDSIPPHTFSGLTKAVAQQLGVRSPTGNVFGAAAKNLGTQIIFLGAPGC